MGAGCFPGNRPPLLGATQKSPQSPNKRDLYLPHPLGNSKGFRSSVPESASIWDENQIYISPYTSQHHSLFPHLSHGDGNASLMRTAFHFLFPDASHSVPHKKTDAKITTLERIPTRHERSGATLDLIFLLFANALSVPQAAPSQSPEKEVIADGKVPCPRLSPEFNLRAVPAAVFSISVQPASRSLSRVSVLNPEFRLPLAWCFSLLLMEQNFLLHFQRTGQGHANEGCLSCSPDAEREMSMTLLPAPQPSSKPPASMGWEPWCRPSGNSLPASSMIYQFPCFGVVVYQNSLNSSIRTSLPPKLGLVFSSPLASLRSAELP